MSNAKERLTHLVDLAGRDTPEDRRTLVHELSELLLDWPDDYPLSMRAPFDLLLEKAVAEVNAATRTSLAERFAALPDAPVGLLNALFFDASDAVKAAILRRNALASEARETDQPSAEIDEAGLIAAAREQGSDTLATRFARALGVDGALAKRILGETSGGALAAACKGVHLNRATYSTLALLFAPQDETSKELRLGLYDAVPQEGAENLIRFWRAHPHAGASQDKTEAA